VQPLLFQLDYIAKLFITLFAVLWGARDLTFAPLFQIYTHFTSLFGDDGQMFQDGTVFIGRRASGEDGYWTGSDFFWNLIRLPFMPLIAIPLALIIAFGGAFTLSMVLLTLLLIVLLALGGAYLIAKLGETIKDREAWYLNQEEQDLIVCGGKRITSFADLPKNKKTLYLRYKAIKSQVCRPFARG
jgi:hypothetical protein